MGPNKLECYQGDQMIWKKSPNFLKSTQNNPNNTKIQTIFLNSLYWRKCNKLVTKGVTIMGYFFVSKNHNGPTKSSLIVEKFA
jgi:hypothetical protein